MERWSGKVALVTGGSAGIGAGVVERLAEYGMKVVACARNVEPIERMKAKFKANNSVGEIIPVKCDLRKEGDILEMFRKIKEQLGVVHVCINNAGLGHNAPLLTGDPSQWRELWEVNVHALCVCSKESITLMRESNVDDGHVIHISSLSAHRLSDKSEFFYGATKHAVRAITEGQRRELWEAKSHIRVTSVSPGNVTTEFVHRMYDYDKELQKQMATPTMKELEVKDVIDAVIFILSTPPHVQVHELMIRPVEQEK